jgi:hypothetical protein
MLHFTSVLVVVFRSIKMGWLAALIGATRLALLLGL